MIDSRWSVCPGVQWLEEGYCICIFVFELSIVHEDRIPRVPLARAFSKPMKGVLFAGCPNQILRYPFISDLSLLSQT